MAGRGGSVREFKFVWYAFRLALYWHMVIYGEVRIAADLCKVGSIIAAKIPSQNSNTELGS